MSRSKRKPNYRLPLHLVHIAAGLLTTLFLLLEGVSGPGAGYWWIDVKYSNGESWHLGGLGACKVGEKWVTRQCRADCRCTFGLHAPAHYSQVHGALSWHIAGESSQGPMLTLSRLHLLQPRPRQHPLDLLSSSTVLSRPSALDDLPNAPFAPTPPAPLSNHHNASSASDSDRR